MNDRRVALIVYVVLNVAMFSRTIAGVYADEVDALRCAHSEPIPENVIRRVVEPHNVRESYPA